MVKRRRRPKGEKGEPPHEDAPTRVTPPADVRQRPFAEALREVTAPARKAASPGKNAAAPREEPKRAPGVAEVAKRAGAEARPVGGPAAYEYRDRAAFQQAFADVKPLGGRHPPRVAASAPAEPTADVAASEARARARLDALVRASVRFDVERDDDGVRGLRAGSHPSVLRELARYDGSAPEALDLHGMRAAEGRSRVTRFVRAAVERGVSVVLVVHGKGLHSGAAGAVLRDVVVLALTTDAGRYVLAFAPAPPRLGDGGALLVRVGRR